ncbi:MAG: ABC transporter permease, partial [Saprospiraceae bacterium]|nr:ABC transporter permease [Saprospiraceae bacterium]
MRFDQFIANRLRGSIANKSFSRVIIQIAIASVALSVAVMIVASAMIHGFKTEISQKIFDFWGHIQITDAFITPTFEATPIRYDSSIVDSLYDIDYIYYEEPRSFFGWELGSYRTRRTQGGVKRAYRYIQYPGVITAKDDFEGILLKGVGQDFDPQFFDRYLTDGVGLRLNDHDAPAQVVISQMTSQRLHLSVDDQIIIHFVRDGRQVPRRFTVVGIYKTGLAEYDRKIAFVHLTHLQRVLQWLPGQISGIEVLLDDIDDLEVMNDYMYQEILPPEIYTRTVRDRSSSIFDWLDLQNINETIILSLMLIVCIVNMITTMLILILERTNMIGILKALGSSNWQVRKIFVRQAASILLKGLIIGNLLGLALGMLQKKFEFIKLREEDYYLAVAPIEFNFPMIMAINVGTLIITILFLILPSYLISRISPSKA